MSSTFVSRRESMERWQAALRRANDKGVKVYKLETIGVYVATSGSRSLVCYRTDGASCECAAAQSGDPVCVHRAKYWQVAGMLTLDDAAPATMPCGPCEGTGQIWSEGQWSADPCFICSGRGCVDVVIDRISPNNIVEFPRIDSPRPAA